MKHVAAALAIRDGHILLARRAPGQSLAGLWEFPGGKQEPSETIQQCIEREIREELSLSCRARQVFTESVYQYEAGAIKLIGVLVDISLEEPGLTVHDRIAWVPIADMLSYELAPADIPIAKEVINVYG
ncbi:(deoxy)nucleoside triphosphate pyrophosphohydrolase [Halomonas sp. MCCC 1A17488]|uniref:(deoxy)nucleoside triphosphate pyrophosphohydrolase n=1 Tax=unclassified Halomonas TaxID=2609666 RepID=UPI0018D201B1|nr:MULTISPECIES: (deoxy)nucleoside triphosphate pyrophosphohydrolase [unclassified Halomonas]MCE8015946.1 (deoxy)nucleoside triphosphate pyrophosphohydrolase [Halomonas sp. MCCC 1A17488]MCG3239279.1 (deoxy)nucleoside triphosphate pyrophosphohydrolase [Halomonas sp. MCCC 1A17488]QPP50788.1 (deoxy)nucleoside triphosphate pyrophosphohydrolase [Halomonas sp. SS10-MC5]